MSADQRKVPCPNCGAPVYLTDDVCLSCGVRLDEGKLAENVPAQQAPAPAATDVQGTAAPTAQAAGGGQAVAYQTLPGARPWHPADLGADGGFFPSLARAWAFFKESLAMGYRDSDVLVPSVLALFANLLLVGVLALILHLTGQLQPLLEEEAEPSVALYSLLVAFTLLGYIVSYFLTSMTVNMVDAYLRGQDAELKVAFADALKNLGAILWIAVIATLINMLTSAMRGKDRRRTAGDLAADAIDKTWQVASLLLLPIIIIEDLPFGEASKRALKLHSQSIIQVVIAEVGLTVLQKILGAVLLLFAVVPAVLAYYLAFPLFYVGLGWAILVLVVTMSLLMYVRTAFYTCLYLWAAAVEAAGEDVPAPAPLQKALSGA